MSESKETDVQLADVTATEAKDTKQSQPEKEVSKTVTLEEFNNAMAAVKRNTEEKVLKKYADVDIEKYRELLTKEEQLRIDEQKKRGEFEKILKETAEKKDQQINQLRTQLNQVKVDGAIVNAASKYKAINPDQVARLVKEKVRLSEAGEVEVIGDNGAPRYTDSGEPMSVDLLVKEFIDQNAHFKAAGPSGSGSTGNTKPKSIKDIDISQLDLNNPEHRKIYAQYKQSTSDVKRMF